MPDIKTEQKIEFKTGQATPKQAKAWRELWQKLMNEAKESK